MYLVAAKLYFINQNEKFFCCFLESKESESSKKIKEKYMEIFDNHFDDLKTKYYVTCQEVEPNRKEQYSDLCAE